MFWPHLLFAQERVFVSIKSQKFYKIVVILHAKIVVFCEVRTSGHSHTPIFYTWDKNFAYNSESQSVIPCNYENPCIYNLLRDFYVL